MIFSGLYTALVTPFREDSSLDEEGLAQLILDQKTAGVDGIVVIGSTGEASTLNVKEKARIIEIAYKHKGEMKLVVGTGSFSTDVTIEQTKMAQELKADAALVVTPYYNRPTQEGIYRHFEKVAASSSLPLLLYHIPARTASTLEIETIKKIAQISSICGMKDSIKNLQNTIEVMTQVKSERSDFAYFAGDDPLLIPMMALGSDGLISASANIFPKQLKEMILLCQRGELDEARKLFYSFYPLMRALFSQSNPIGVKAALNLMQKPAGPPRMPLLPATSAALELIKQALQEQKLI